MIEIENVSYSYPGSETYALRNVSLRIEKGEAVTLLGPNGCGKSTFLKLINGLILPGSGTCRFGGEEVTDKKMQNPVFAGKLHQRIGFIFQQSEAQLFCPDVYDEIAFGPRQTGLSEEEVGRRVNDCLELLSIGGLMHRSPYHLSGGEKRKVAIASVLSMNPEVLVLDEPMNGLDPRTCRWLTGFLKSLNQAGRTIVLTTHNLELVEELSDRSILFDEDNTIAADLPTGKLLDDLGLLKRVNLVDEFYRGRESRT